MTFQFPVLIVLFPLFTALLVTVVGWFKPRYVYYMTVLGLLGSVYSAVKVALKINVEGAQHYYLGNWPAPFGIEYVVDHLNALVLVMVTLVSFLTAVYSKRSVEKEIGDRIASFYTLFLLLITGLLGITITGDAFNLYVLMEVSALTSYGLLAFGKGRSYLSTFNYVIMGSMGACFYLLGVGYLLIKTGSLNMLDMSRILSSVYLSQSILIAFIFIIVGLWIKMAFFPLHGWLPNTYSQAPVAVACLVAPLMTKVAIYVMVRMMFFVFSADYVYQILNWQPWIVGLSILAIVVGSLYAVAQRRLKKMLTYLVVAEIGYMVGGVWLGTTQGIRGAIYHILADGLMTLCLFMAVGALIYKVGEDRFGSIQGKFRQMPVTMMVFLVGAFSMIGIPPTCGFFSKWYLISGAIEGGYGLFAVALIFSSLMNAIIFFRLIEIGFFTPQEVSETESVPSKIDEAPRSMIYPMIVVASLVIILGLSTQNVMTYFIDHIVPDRMIAQVL